MQDWDLPQLDGKPASCDMNPLDLVSPAATWVQAMRDAWKRGQTPDGKPLLSQPAMLVRAMRVFENGLATCQQIEAMKGGVA